MSHPARVRGLKRAVGTVAGNTCESHPARVRGLKPSQPPHIGQIRVAPRAGAWIETTRPFVTPQLVCRTPRGCVD